MSNDMKVIMENWRKEVLSEAPIQTVGQLKKVINSYRLTQAGKEGAKKDLDQIIDEVPVVGTLKRIWGGLKDANQIAKKMMGVEDEFKTQTGLDLLNIPDNMSKIVDDRIETAFINYFLKFLGEQDDNDPIPDVEQKFNEFLRARFDNHQVKK